MIGAFLFSQLDVTISGVANWGQSASQQEIASRNIAAPLQRETERVIAKTLPIEGCAEPSVGSVPATPSPPLHSDLAATAMP